MSKINQLAGYYYAIMNYLRTPKGRHDAVDYVRAIIIVAGVIAVIGLIFKVV